MRPAKFFSDERFLKPVPFRFSSFKFLQNSKTAMLEIFLPKRLSSVREFKSLDVNCCRSVSSWAAMAFKMILLSSVLRVGCRSLTKAAILAELLWA